MENQDLVEEILLRLPAKSLLRLRCVCKSWYALITSSRFIDKHHALQRSFGNDRIIVEYFKNGEKKHVVRYYNDYECLSLMISPPEFEIPGYLWGWPPIFVGEVNDIVCYTDAVRIKLMNPALREYRMLPEVSYRANGVGFGYDELTKDYKVLILINNVGYASSHLYSGAIYSLRSNSWRELGNIPLLESYYVNYKNLPYVFFNGSLHWYAESHMMNDMIITFNMTTESFKEMQAPQYQPVEDYSYYTTLFVIDKSFLKFVSITVSRFLNVWVMKEYGMEDSWTKEYRIQLISSIRRPPLTFWKNDKLLFTTKKGNELVCYDLPSGQLQHVQQFDCCDYYDPSIGLVVYNETLVSINNNI